MHFLKSPIIYNTPLCPALYKLALNAPSIASIASPGQFVMVKTSTSSDPLLARPFSISKVLPNKTNHSCLEILYRVVGRGTHLLTKFRQGENVQLFGPLGNGFQLDNNSKHLIIVAGGIGIAPMRFLIDRVIALRSSKFFSSEPTVPTITLFFGAKNGLEVPIADSLMNTVNAVYVTTEDGSRGTQGMITDIFKSYAESIEFPHSSAVFSCGPYQMQKLTHEICKKVGVRLQVLLESEMACGMGVCLGCSYKARVELSESQDYMYKRVCRDGPVIESDELLWE